MTDWLFTWKGILAVLIIVGIAAAVGYVYQEGTLANIASIVGLAVSVLGFVITIWTVIDARKQITEAADRAEEAVAEAREESRRAIAGIAALLRAGDCAALQTGIENVRQDAKDAQWARAAYRCHECRRVAIRLEQDEHMTDEEKSGLRAVADNLLLILQFIEKNRLAGKPENAMLPLERPKIQSLDEMIGLLARI
jgi:hypothetical protein